MVFASWPARVGIGLAGDEEDCQPGERSVLGGRRYEILSGHPPVSEIGWARPDRATSCRPLVGMCATRIGSEPKNGNSGAACRPNALALQQFGLPTLRGSPFLAHEPSELLLCPVWHHYSGRTQAHVMICVLAYALWKTLDHLAKRASLETEIRKPEPRRAQAVPKPRPMTPEVILRELGQIAIGDILLATTDGQKLAVRRLARPMAEQKRILGALGLEIPERLSQDWILS
jgi:hypothetical protein